MKKVKHLAFNRFKRLVPYLVMGSVLIAIFFLIFKQVAMVHDNLSSENIGDLVTSLGALGSVLLLIVTYMTLRETVNQREAYESPVLIVRLVPGQKNPNMLHFAIKNTGGGPTYDTARGFGIKSKKFAISNT